MIFTELLTVAKKKYQRLEPASAWDATTYHRFVVPVDKRWFILHGYAVRNTSSTCTITLSDASNDVIQQIALGAAATGAFVWPSTVASVNNLYPFSPWIIEGGEKCVFAFGVAQGAGAEIVLHYMEIDV